MNKHKAMIISDHSFQNNKKLFEMVILRETCRLKFDEHLWTLFLDKPKLDVVVFKILFSDIQKYCNGMDLWNIYKY